MRSPRRAPGTRSRRGSSAVDRTPTHSTQNDKHSTFSSLGHFGGAHCAPRVRAISLAPPSRRRRPFSRHSDCCGSPGHAQCALPYHDGRPRGSRRVAVARPQPVRPWAQFPVRSRSRHHVWKPLPPERERIFRIQHGCVPKSRMAESRHLGKSFHSTWACLRPILASIRTGRSRRNSTFLSEFTWGLVHRTRRTSRARRQSRRRSIERRTATQCCSRRCCCATRNCVST